ncbi:MAG: pyridoxamine 5'-phosphate oxidase family protein [Eubacterium sp.]|nr:pyridoxamine 5'-phosphate oxidase family protein [Eubacterium sp.]
MFRDMRRKRQALSKEICEEILRECTSGVLALQGDNDYPYAVALSHCYLDGKLYFHCAVEGHKIDAVKNNDKCSFCVIYKDDVVPEKFTTFYKSVICFGRIKLLESTEDKVRVLNLLSDKYSPDIAMPLREKEINSSLNRVAILELNIEHMTGKQCIEFVKN